MNDFNLALRQLRERPGFTLVAVLILAIGIGGTPTLFRILRAVFLGQCPYQDPKTLVQIYETKPSKDEYRLDPSGPSFRDWRQQNQVFAQMAANDGRIDFQVQTAEGIERGGALLVSRGFFSMLGVKPLIGRTFLPEEYRGGGERVVVLSYFHWQRWFHGDAGILGKTLKLNDTTYTVVGVLPASFRWVFQPVVVGLWLPFTDTDRTDRADRGVRVFARLKPGLFGRPTHARDRDSHGLGRRTGAGPAAGAAPRHEAGSCGAGAGGGLGRHAGLAEPAVRHHRNGSADLCPGHLAHRGRGVHGLLVSRAAGGKGRSDGGVAL